MYFRLNMRQVEIAEQLGVSQAQISRDIKRILKEYRRDRIEDIEASRSKEAAGLDEMERDVALEFIRVKGTKASSSAWVNTRVRIKERRAKLLGLDKPEQSEVLLKGPLDITIHRDRHGH